MKKYLSIILTVSVVIWGLWAWVNQSNSEHASSGEKYLTIENKQNIKNNSNSEIEKAFISLGAFQGKPSRLILDLNKAQDYKEFALYAKNFPSEGGVSYSQYVAGACWLALKTVESKEDIDKSRYKEAEKLAGKCSGFGSSTAALELSNSLDSQLSQKDSFVILSKKLSDIRNRTSGDERLSVLATLFENPDALLLATESNRIFSLRTAASEGGSLYFSFGGERYFYNTNPPAIEALKLLPCAYGADCSSDGLLAIQHCLNEGKCSGSYHERVLSSMSKESQAERWNAIEKFYRSMIASIDNKKASDFM